MLGKVPGTYELSAELQAAWQAAAESSLATATGAERPADAAIPEQFLILITCRDERHQVELLNRFQGEGLECKALLS